MAGSQSIKLSSRAGLSFFVENIFSVVLAFIVQWLKIHHSEMSLAAGAGRECSEANFGMYEEWADSQDGFSVIVFLFFALTGIEAFFSLPARPWTQEHDMPFDLCF